MNKSFLIQQYKTALKLKRKGAVGTKANYYYAMHNITQSLYKLRLLPHRWEDIDDSIINSLVRYWLKHGNSERTINNKLYILRKVILAMGGLVRFTHVQISKSKPAVKSKSSLPDFSLSIIDNRLIRNIIAFEYYFGLTKGESMRYAGHHIEATENKLIINRAIAHNKERRSIPIENEQQQKVFAERKILAEEPIAYFFDFKRLASFYNDYGAIYQLYPSMRDYYINRRLMQLSHLGSAQAICTIMNETGIHDKRTLDSKLCHQMQKS